MANDTLKKTGKPNKQVDYIVLELAEGGELFDFVCNSGHFSETVAKTYFIQMMDALKYMHTAGICHRDLKPENIMLDSNFNIKIADFGFAAPTIGKDKSGQLHTLLGTQSYMAPEIHLERPYSGQSVDLFACAIILFIMLTQRPPFNEAHPNDPHYKMLAAGRKDMFWKAHMDADPDQAGLFKDDFMDLFTKMTMLNPKHRLTIDQIIAHPWMKGPTATQAEIK
jgi:serine/threonine protein kinase